jgi:phosphatidate cytidylyltransferase
VCRPHILVAGGSIKQAGILRGKGTLAQPKMTGPYHENESGLLGRACLVLAIVAVVLVVLWLAPALLFNLGVAAVALIALRELYLLDPAGSQDWTYRSAGLAGGTLLVLQMAIFPTFPFGMALTLVVLLFLCYMVAKTVAPSMEELRELLFVIFGIIYVGGMFGQLVLIRNANHGRELVALLMTTVLARELGAALGGRLVASSWPLNTYINPRKSYVGAAIGIAAGIGAAIWLSRHISAGLTLTRAAVFGLCVGAACQFGDLAESYLKRATGRRHSSALLGPEGGLLDFLDAVAFAVVVANLVFYLWSH